MTEDAVSLKVGDVARVAGLSVRAMRYYDEIGLLRPSRRSPSGHRLYDESDVRRLYRICLLRKTGLPLGDIARALDRSSADLRRILPLHLEMVDQQLATARSSRTRLLAMISALGSDTTPSAAQFMETLEDMTMLTTPVQRRISILVYDDIASMYAWLARVFGLGAGRLESDGEGRCVHGELDAGDGVIWLHPSSPRFGLVSPRTAGAATGTTAIMVDDVDAHHRSVVAEGVEVLYEPVDMPYGYREYSARDPEGGFWSFMKALD